MGAFNATLGALLMAVIINTYLYGIVTFQYASYYTSKFQDPTWIRYTILSLFLTDTFHSICIIYMAWIYAVENFTNPMGLMVIVWPFPFSAIMMAVTAFVVQLFLSYRISLLTRNRFIAAVVALLAVGTFVSGMTVGIKVWLAADMTHLGSVNKVLTVWLTAEVVIDGSIAAILLFALHKSTTGFQQSDRVLKRLVRTCMQTGLCTGVFALLCMILFLALPGTQYYLMFGLPISRVYTCTLMDTLLGRQVLRGMLQGTDKYVGSSAFGVSVTTDRHVERDAETGIYLENQIQLHSRVELDNKKILRESLQEASVHREEK